MSTDEGFLSRWSRRKREAAKEMPGKAKPETEAHNPAPQVPAAAPVPEDAQPCPDPATLPPIDEISAESDISGFLASGVPEALTRAALRRAWSADPATRDFIGLSENSWDFTAPGGVPGFGPLQPEEVSRLLAQAMGELDAPAPAHPPTGQPPSDPKPPPVEGSMRAMADAGDPMMGVDVPIAPDKGNNAALQHHIDRQESSPSLPLRRSGGALPK
jgi:hypothetical protein